jgi:hypothetical protein
MSQSRPNESEDDEDDDDDDDDDDNDDDDDDGDNGIDAEARAGGEDAPFSDTEAVDAGDEDEGDEAAEFKAAADLFVAGRRRGRPSSRTSQGSMT